MQRSEALRGKGKLAVAVLGAVAAGGVGVSQLAFQSASSYGVRCGQGFGYGYASDGITFGYGCDTTVDKITTGVGSGGGPNVRLFEGPFLPVEVPQASYWGIQPHEANTGGVNVARGDIDGDGVDEVIAAAAAAGDPRVFVLSAGGVVRYSFDAYAAGFRGGISLAAGDVDADGKDEIFTGAGPGGGPNVRVFRVSPTFTSVTNLDSFFAYAESFAGGVNVAAVDVDGDKQAELVTGAGPGGGPNVRVFEYGVGQRALVASFFAYDPAFSGGVNVGGVRFGNGEQSDIVTGVGPGGGPNVKTFSFTNGLTNRLSFFAYDPEFKGGVFVAGGDLNGTGLERIITGVGPGGGPNVRVFNGATLVDSFFAYDPGFKGGVRVAAGQTPF